ncbi:MAG: hypothetical protein IJ728_00090 [Selenomonadaceae bacterium]|nr:hypothetical protein [Selenomonadaceae bacterium]
MKLSIKILIVICFVIAIFNLYNYESPNPYKDDPLSALKKPVEQKKEQCINGYLKKGASWTDEYEDVYHMNELHKTGRVHGVMKDTKIEVWGLNDDAIVMIYFLEGKYAGKWGYAVKSFTISEKKYKKRSEINGTN